MGKSSLSGQVVAVTGGASGIGFAIVQKLVSLGAKVAVCDISPCPDSLADVPELTFTRVDATSREDVRKWVGATVAKYGRLDAMVPNAGSNFERPGVQRDDAWTKTLDLVLSGPWYAATEAYDQFRKQSGGGAICTTSSIAGLNPSRGAPIYSACKAGVNGLTKALAVEWAKDNVRINAVAPGKERCKILQYAIVNTKTTL